MDKSKCMFENLTEAAPGGCNHLLQITEKLDSV